MHDDMLTLLDAHLAHLRTLREQLAASRRVTPGERHAAALRSAEASERFAAHARMLLAGQAVTR
jgi:hypothetical protein